MRKQWMGIVVVAGVVAGQAQVRAHDAKNLPPGPIHDRHELMEGIGKNAKAIGNALKSGDLKAVPEAASAIKKDAAKILPLFPPGSTHAESRAKPEIWTDWKTFEAGAKDLEKTSGDLAATAKSGGDVSAAADKMFDNCKGCHEKFRVPEKK
ncbi:MAG: cytochrome c [Deltaproteobacteria bacterium]|nr:cytochrome c [Deltaproteobacteria bacterium]